MSPLRDVTLAGLAKKYPKNGGVRKANCCNAIIIEKIYNRYIYSPLIEGIGNQRVQTSLTRCRLWVKFVKSPNFCPTYVYNLPDLRLYNLPDFILTGRQHAVYVQASRILIKWPRSKYRINITLIECFKNHMKLLTIMTKNHDIAKNNANLLLPFFSAPK